MPSSLLLSNYPLSICCIKSKLLVIYKCQILKKAATLTEDFLSAIRLFIILIIKV